MSRVDRVLADRFLDDLSSSDLIPGEVVAAVRGDSSPTASIDELAAEFVRRGLLTPYQAEAASRGKAARLVLGSYALLEPIGRGGMGRVYKAVHRRMRRTVALKVLSVPPGRDPETRRKRFHREVEAAARLDHPNVVAVYDAGVIGGVFYLAMEYVEGCDLAELVERDGPLSIGRAADALAQAAAGLAHAHDKGLVHRDVKPANIMWTAGGVAKVLDLGLARLEESAEAGLTRMGTGLGTIDWMAPELAADARAAGPAADLYGLGCTLHFLLTGRTVYTGQSPVETLIAHRRAAIPSLRTERPEVPEAMDALFRTMIAKRPADRPTSMREVEAMLASFRALPTEGAGAGGSGPIAPAPQPARLIPLKGARGRHVPDSRGSRPFEGFHFDATEPIAPRPPAPRQRIAIPREIVPLLVVAAVLVAILAWFLSGAVFG